MEKKVVKISYSTEIAGATIFNFTCMYPFKINYKRAISKKQSSWPYIGLPCMYAKKVHITVLFSSDPGVGPSRPSARNSPKMKLVSSDL